MFVKLRISLIFPNLVLSNSLSLNHRMHNLYTKFVRILEICKRFSYNPVNEQGNIVRRGPNPQPYIAQTIQWPQEKTAGLCEEIRKRLAMRKDGGEDFFVVDSKPIEVCRLARGKCAWWGGGEISPKCPISVIAPRKSPQENWDAVLTTDRPIPCHQELR